MKHQIENAKHKFFTDKEHYLSFKKAWAKASQAGKTTAAHHILYNLLRGYDISRGFTPITNRNKLENGAYINHGLYFASHNLRHKIDDARRVVKNDFFNADQRKYTTKTVNSFLGAFGGTVTPQMLVNILKETSIEVKALESDFGPGKKIAEKILSAEVKPISYDQIWELYEEVVNG